MREVSYQALVIPTKLVPAEAGSGNPVFLATSGFWIPASAGMTVIFATSHRRQDIRFLRLMEQID